VKKEKNEKNIGGKGEINREFPQKCPRAWVASHSRSIDRHTQQKEKAAAKTVKRELQDLANAR